MSLAAVADSDPDRDWTRVMFLSFKLEVVEPRLRLIKPDEREKITLALLKHGLDVGMNFDTDDVREHARSENLILLGPEELLYYVDHPSEIPAEWNEFIYFAGVRISAVDGEDCLELVPFLRYDYQDRRWVIGVHNLAEEHNVAGVTSIVGHFACALRKR